MFHICILSIGVISDPSEINRPPSLNETGDNSEEIAPQGHVDETPELAGIMVLLFKLQYYHRNA